MRFYNHARKRFRDEIHGFNYWKENFEKPTCALLFFHIFVTSKFILTSTYQETNEITFFHGSTTTLNVLRTRYYNPHSLLWIWWSISLQIRWEITRILKLFMKLANYCNHLKSIFRHLLIKFLRIYVYENTTHASWGGSILFGW